MNHISLLPRGFHRSSGLSVLIAFSGIAAFGFIVFRDAGLNISSSALASPQAPHSLENRISRVRLAMSSHADGYGENVRRLASELWNTDKCDDAIGLLDELVRNPERPSELAFALRQQGEYHLRLGHRAEAASCFERHVECVQKDPAILGLCGTSYYNALFQLAAIKMSGGATDEAAVLIDRLIADNESFHFMDGAQALTAYRQKAQLAAHAGNPQSAAASLEVARIRVPEAWSQERLVCEWELLRLTDPSQSSDNSLETFQSLWNDADLQSDPNILFVGLQFAQGLVDRGRQPDACDVAFEAVMKLHSHSGEWANPENKSGSAPISAENLRQEELGLLAFLQSADTHGRPQHAKFAAQRLINLLPPGKERDTAQTDLVRLESSENGSR